MRQAGKQAKRNATGRQAGGRQTGINTDRQRDKQAERQRDWKAYRQVDRVAGSREAVSQVGR